MFISYFILHPFLSRTVTYEYKVNILFIPQEFDRGKHILNSLSSPHIASALDNELFFKLEVFLIVDFPPWPLEQLNQYRPNSE